MDKKLRRRIATVPSRLQRVASARARLAEDIAEIEDAIEAIGDEDAVTASVFEPGIEDEITQDYLDGVLRTRQPADVTDDSMLDAAPSTDSDDLDELIDEEIAESLEVDDDFDFSASDDEDEDIEIEASDDDEDDEDIEIEASDDEEDDDDEDDEDDAEERTAMLRSASRRLDRVANYLERQGRVDLAARIDTVADAVDARIKTTGRA